MALKIFDDEDNPFFSKLLFKPHLGTIATNKGESDFRFFQEPGRSGNPNLTRAEPMEPEQIAQAASAEENCKKKRRDGTNSFWKCMLNRGYYPGKWGGWVVPNSIMWDEHEHDVEKKNEKIALFKKKGEEERKHREEECKEYKQNYATEKECKTSENSYPWWWLVTDEWDEYSVRSVTADYITEEEEDDNFKSIWEAGSDYMDQTVGPIMGIAESILNCKDIKELGIYEYIKSLFKKALAISIGPILIIYLFIPIIISFYIALNTSKNITIDYINIIKILINQLIPYSLLILFIFSGILISKWNTITNGKNNELCFKEIRKLVFIVCFFLILSNGILKVKEKAKNNKNKVFVKEI